MMRTVLALALVVFVVGCGAPVKSIDSSELASAFQINAKLICVPAEVRERPSATFVLAKVSPNRPKLVICRHELHPESEVLFGVQYGHYGSNALQYVVYTSWHSKSGADGADRESGVVRFEPELAAWSITHEQPFLKDFQAHEILRVDTSTNDVWTTGLVYWFE